MKKQLLIFSLIIVCSANYLFGQFDKRVDGINYQAIARDTSGKELANQTISVKFSIYDGTSIVWTEEQTTTTNKFGLFTLVIGAIDTSIYTKSNWVSKQPHYLDVSIKLNPNDNYLSMGKTQFQAVPYSFLAFGAKKAAFADSATIANTALVAKTTVYADTALVAKTAIVTKTTIHADTALVAKSIVSDVLVIDSTTQTNSARVYSFDGKQSIVIIKIVLSSITLPLASLAEGKIFYIKNTTAASPITIKPTGGAKINGADTSTWYVSPSFDANTIIITSDGTDWWILSKL